METTKQIMTELGIEEEDFEESKNITRKNIKKKINYNFKRNTDKQGIDKHKVQYHIVGINRMWTPGRRPEYMNKLSRLEVSLIFKTRTRMLEVKNNYRNMYINVICRGCGKEEETQQHILQECNGLHKTEETKVTKEDIFTENTETLKITAKKTKNIMTKLQKA